MPEGFDENKIHYHGGTAIAIESGLLNNDEIKTVNDQMLENVRLSGMPSIGLTLYPTYPEGFLKVGCLNLMLIKMEVTGPGLEEE